MSALEVIDVGEGIKDAQTVLVGCIVTVLRAMTMLVPVVV